MKFAITFRDLLNSLAIVLVGLVSWRAPLLSAPSPDLRMVEVFLMGLGVMWLTAGIRGSSSPGRRGGFILPGALILAPAVYEGMAGWSQSGRAAAIPLLAALTLYRSIPALCAAALIGLVLRWSGLALRGGRGSSESHSANSEGAGAKVNGV